MKGATRLDKTRNKEIGKPFGVALGNAEKDNRSDLALLEKKKTTWGKKPVLVVRKSRRKN